MSRRPPYLARIDAAAERRRQAMLGIKDAMTELRVANAHLVVALLAAMGFSS